MKALITKKIFSLLLAISMVFNTFIAIPLVALDTEEEISVEKDETTESEKQITHAYRPFDSIKEYQYSENADQVDESSLLLKVSVNAPSMSPIPEEFTKRGVSLVRTVVDVTTPEAMAELQVSEPYRWIMVGFENEKATEVALSFADIPYVLDAEYNYTRQSSQLPEAEKNPLMSNQWHLDDPSLKNAWKYLDDNDLHDDLEQVVVAVIDTGVDYTHPNLVNSMWINVNEVPGDGIDNDGNGYVDDVYGASTIGNIFDANGDPMDEMGHGTHVAGIIAASANSMGAVGVAYGSKIMAIKAGDSSGIFNDSDVIEAINYAILMGADVINMSFGSYARSAAIEDALALAYTSAILVAAAGNDGVDIVYHGMPSYPAAYNFVIGVMATDANGAVAGFSNTDYVLRRNSLEYEICAPGASIFSTLPANRYASWSGTSMACPYVSAVAALLRAKYNDKSVYSTRYIMGQLVGTAIDSKGAFPKVDPYAALTEIPEPDVSYYDYYIFDDPAYSDKNNGDGIIDSGETIGLGVLIRNHWGQARNTKVKLISAANSTDATLCPYVTWITDTIDYGDVGTFNSANNGFSYDTDGVITGISNPFMFTVAENTPNDYHLPFSLVIECESYTEQDQTKTFRFDKDVFQIQVRKGYELPRLIDTDMTLTADQYYIISGSTLIENGVTVTVEPGTQIQFWGDYSKELYAGTDVAELLVDGELIIKGTETNPVDIFPSGGMSDMKVDIRTRLSTGKIVMEYCNIANPVLDVTTIDHCYFTQMMFDYMCELHKDMDGHWYHNITIPRVYADKISNSIFYELGFRYLNYDYRLSVGGELISNLFDSCGLNFTTWDVKAFRDNVFLKNYRLVEAQINDRTYLTSEFNIHNSYNGSNILNPLYPVKNPETGSTYFVLQTPSITIAENFAKLLGGSVAFMDDEAEKEFIFEYAKRYYAYNEELKDYTWDSCFNNLIIGFYADGKDIRYLGKGNDEDWLKIPPDSSIPVINTSYFKNQKGDVTREAWISYYYSGDSYFINNLFGTNPSERGETNRGVIIEIPGEITPLSVSLECDALTIPSNTVDYRVLASVYPSTDNYSLSWSSSDESVVKVSENGKLTATGVGTAVVTVTVDGLELSASMVVVVTQYYAPESITDTDTEILITSYQGTKKLSPVIAPAEASALIEYTSSDTNVAVVGFDGTVTAISSGTAVVTAKIVGTDLSINYTVKVIIPPEEVELVKDYVILSMNGNETASLEYYFAPDYATVGRAEYLSSDESVVRVTETGELTAVDKGNAVVWVSFPDIDRALQAKVVVVEDASSVKIVRSTPLANWQGASVLYAEDGTTYLLMNEKVYGNSRLVQTFPFKTKGVTCVYTEQWYYIDMENNLRGLYSNSYDKVSLIDEGVSDIWSTRYNGNRFYYQKTDGTVWYYVDGYKAQNEWIENIKDVVVYNGRYIFLDEEGRIWVDLPPSESADSLTSRSFDTQLYALDKKIVFLTSSGCFDEDGAYYGFDFPESEFNMYKSAGFEFERIAQTLKITWDQVVDVTYSASISETHWLLLLEDGRIVYVGYNNPGGVNMLRDLISVPTNSGIGYCFLELDQTFADLGPTALVGSDGSVLTYVTDYGAILGNGKSANANQSLRRPVIPWIGTVDDEKDVTFDKVAYTDGEGSAVNETIDALNSLKNKVNCESGFALTLSKPVKDTMLSSIVLKDGFGTRIELKSAVDRLGKTLTITPKTPLKAGYDYTLSIPAAAVSDEFGNSNRTFTLNLTVSGTAVYAVPVTGVEADGESTVNLEFGQMKQLSVNVLPENASMRKVYWSSSNERVATVTQTGYVTGHYNGTAIITATTADGGHTCSFTVTVSTQPETVSLSTGYFLLEVGGKGKIEISSYPYHAELGVLNYGSNREDIVTVDDKGVLTARGLGSTLVYVTSSTTGKSYYALVDVVEDSSFATIRSAHTLNSRSDLAYFIAEDNSVWYITTNSYSGENTYLPRKAKFSAKALTYDNYWGSIYYISTDNRLYRTDNTMQSSWNELIADDVAAVELNGEHIFYVKTDGSTYHNNRNTGMTTKCSILTGTSKLYCLNGNFYFVDQTGVLRYVRFKDLEKGVSNSVFKTVKIPTGERIASVAGSFAIGVDNGIYLLSLENDENIVASEAISFRDSAEYKAIKSEIAEIERAYHNGYEAFIARLKNGDVYFLGNGYSVPIGLKDVVDTSDQSAENSFTIARKVKGIANAVDIATGYIVLSDGTVRAYQASNNEYDQEFKKMLANNNLEMRSYRMPVVSWFGANGSYEDILLNKAQSALGDSYTDISVGNLTESLDVGSRFVLTFHKQLFTVIDGISLIDMGGVLVPVDVTISDRSLIITPKEPLKEGTLYTLSIPSGSVLDIFLNTTGDIEINFTTTGELHFAKPVEGITDTISQFTLSYGDMRQLAPTIAPSDASMKRVSWTTSDQNVATVTQDGLVTGVQNGTATITVTTFDGDFTYSYTVTVYTPVESFELSEEFVILDLSGKKTVQLVGKVTPSYLSANGLFRWVVADPDIAAVSKNGTVTALKAGVTAVYCYCEGIDEPVVCIISVVSDYDDVFINRVTKKYNGFLFESNGCLWITDSQHTIPEKLVFTKPAKGEGEAEPIDISAMKQVLSIPETQYGSELSRFLTLFLEEDGTLSFYHSNQKDRPCHTKTDVKKMLYTSNYLILLMNDGTLLKVTLNGTYMQPDINSLGLSLYEETISEIAGIRDIVCHNNSGTLVLLQINKGLVWTYNFYSEERLTLIFNEEPIIDITVGDGSFMLGESGKLYPLQRDESEYDSMLNELVNRGFYNLAIEIEDVVNVGSAYNPRLIILTKEGKLAYFGHEAENFPLAEKYSGYTWKQEANCFYYIETGKTVKDIGRNFILFSDGTVRMFGDDGYFGNAEYSKDFNTSFCAPYFTETDVDIHSLTLNKVTVGDTEIYVSAPEAPSVDPADKITLEMSLPLVPTDMLLATTVQDSQGNYPEFDIRVEGRKIILTFKEALRAGETYTVTIYSKATQDIFNNSGESIKFTFTVNNTAQEVQSYEESLYPTTEYSPDWTLKQLQSKARDYYDEILHDYIVEHSDNVGNAFLNAFANPDTTSWMSLVASQSVNSISSLIGNFWGTVKKDLIDRIIYDVNDSFNYGEILYDPMLTEASETAYPFVTSIVVKNSEGNIVSSVGMEEITVEVYFNRNMDTEVQPMVAYGSEYPFGDFAVTGDWKDARTWVGTTKISAVTGSGVQYFKVRGAVAEGDSWLVTGNDYERFAFTIATSGAKSMSMQANGGEGYVALEWAQDDYDTMAGYNVYRSELANGSYSKLNNTLLSKDVTSFVDQNVEPGVQYYYYFTVVGTDLKESEPSGIAVASAQDTTPPSVSHSSVTKSPEGAAISIIADVYDNLVVSSVKLYYRAKGQTEYSVVDMYCNVSNYGRYTATIPSSIVGAEGVEYYIEASDGRQSSYCYSAEAPQTVITYKLYTITVMTVTGGRITVSKTRAKAGDRITVAAVANEGYAYLTESLSYSFGGEQRKITNGVFNMPEGNITITATFIEESPYDYGDVNRDGEVNSADAILLLQYDSGLRTFDSEQIVLADVNGDGRISVIDANEILRIDAGM